VTINGIPLHPLVVHAAVVFVPLAALAVVGFVVPKWRAALRWPALGVVAIAATSVQLAAMTGDQLKAEVGRSALIETHEMWAGRLQAATWVLAAVTLVAVYVLPVTSRRPDVEDRSSRLPVMDKPLIGLLPVLAVVVLVLVVLTGDAGARAVWAR
jgi:hypothetical protein